MAPRSPDHRPHLTDPLSDHSGLYRILALEQSGRLLQFKADPNEFQLLGEVLVRDQDTWAYLTTCKKRTLRPGAEWTDVFSVV